MGFVGFDWNNQVSYMVHWWAFVNTIMNLWVPLNHGTIFFGPSEKLSVLMKDPLCWSCLMCLCLLLAEDM